MLAYAEEGKLCCFGRLIMAVHDISDEVSYQAQLEGGVAAEVVTSEIMLAHSAMNL